MASLRNELGSYTYDLLRHALTTPDARDHWPGEEAEEGEPVTPLDEMRAETMLRGL